MQRDQRSGFELSDVIECAADLVDNPVSPPVSEEYRRGVVELAARICLCGDDFDDAVTVMGYAVCGVNKPTHNTVAGGGGVIPDRHIVPAREGEK